MWDNLLNFDEIAADYSALNIIVSRNRYAVIALEDFQSVAVEETFHATAQLIVAISKVKSVDFQLRFSISQDDPTTTGTRWRVSYTALRENESLLASQEPRKRVESADLSTMRHNAIYKFAAAVKVEPYTTLSLPRAALFIYVLSGRRHSNSLFLLEVYYCCVACTRFQFRDKGQVCRLQRDQAISGDISKSLSVRDKISY